MDPTLAEMAAKAWKKESIYPIYFLSHKLRLELSVLVTLYLGDSRIEHGIPEIWRVAGHRLGWSDEFPWAKLDADS